jgi:hypothetical protein
VSRYGRIIASDYTAQNGHVIVHFATIRRAAGRLSCCVFPTLSPVTFEDLIMRFKLALFILAVSCLPAGAQLNSPNLTQGSISVLRGRAHIIEGAEGTYIEIEMANATRRVVGYIPFGDKPTFPQLARAEGHIVQVAGVVGLDGGAMITMTDSTQLAVMD